MVGGGMVKSHLRTRIARLVPSMRRLTHLSLFSLLFSLLFSPLFSLSNNDNDHSSSRLFLCTHGSNLPECQSACASVQFPVWRTCSNHARNNVPGVPVQASCHLEWSGPVSVLEMGDVFVMCLCLVAWACVSMWYYVMVCVVFVVPFLCLWAFFSISCAL